MTRKGRAYHPTKYATENIWDILYSFRKAINFKTLIVTGMSLVITALCHHMKLEADFPLTIISIAIVFPLVFSLRAAFARREKALKNYAILKGNALSVYYGLRDWTPDYQHHLHEEYREMMTELMQLIRIYFQGVHFEKEREELIYQTFSGISQHAQKLRAYNIPATEMSRINQYISKMMIAYGNMKIAYEYRTPLTLRAYSKVFIFAFPILFGPYFASNFSHYVTVLGYLMPVVYSFILISLDNIQDQLEYPYEQFGEDDIFIDAEYFTEIIDS